MLYIGVPLGASGIDCGGNPWSKEYSILEGNGGTGTLPEFHFQGKLFFVGRLFCNIHLVYVLLS